MNFRDYLFQCVGVEDPDDFVGLSVVTDGLSPRKHNVVALIGAEPGKDWPAFTIFVEGAEPEKTAEFTGVQPEEWAAEKVSKINALRRFRELLGDRYVVMHNGEKFGAPFLSKLAVEALAEGGAAEDSSEEAFSRLPFVDSLLVNRARVMSWPFPDPEGMHVNELSKALVDAPKASSGEGLPVVFKRAWPDKEYRLRPADANAFMVRDVQQAFLEMEVCDVEVVEEAEEDF